MVFICPRNRQNASEPVRTRKTLRIAQSSNESVKAQDQPNRRKGSELLLKVNATYSPKIINTPQVGHKFFLKKQKEDVRQKLRKKCRYEHDQAVCPSFRSVMWCLEEHTCNTIRFYKSIKIFLFKFPSLM